MFVPKFTLTPAIAKALMEIEACRQAIIGLPLTAPMLESLRKAEFTNCDIAACGLAFAWRHVSAKPQAAKTKSGSY